MSGTKRTHGGQRRPHPTAGAPGGPGAPQAQPQAGRQAQQGQPQPQQPQQGQPQPQQPQQPPQQGQPEGQSGSTGTAAGKLDIQSDSELDFHYFKSHDFDQNNKVSPHSSLLLPSFHGPIKAIEALN